MVLVPPTSIPSNNEEGVDSIIAGSVIGSSIVLLLLVGFALLVVCIRWHRKTNKGNHIETVLVDGDEVYGVSNHISVGDHSTSELTL